MNWTVGEQVRWSENSSASDTIYTVDGTDGDDVVILAPNGDEWLARPEELERV